jgi:hypothetical protein
MPYSYYTVTVTPKAESWNCREYTTRVYAKDRASAIKEARAEYKANNQDFGQASATFKASKEDEGESPFVLDGYNVEFQGARPAHIGEDY